VLVTQPRHQSSKPEPGAGRGAGGGDRQGQRQPPAQAGQFPGGLRLGADPVQAETAGQQLGRLIASEHVQVHQPGTLGRGQSDQLAAAGHHHHGLRGAGQQRAHLRGIAGVVQHDQHPPPN